MREINKTIYKILKMEEPDEGVNVSQLITDDLLHKSETGEAKAKAGASELLDKKADLIHGKSSTVKKQYKASGTRVGMKIPKEISSNPNSSAPKKVVKKVVKKAGTSAGVTTKKKVVKKAVGKKVVKKKPVAKAAPEKKSSPVMLIVLAVVLIGAGAYAYLELM